MSVFVLDVLDRSGLPHLAASISGSEVVQGVSHKHCRLIQRGDGYGYSRIAISKGDAGVGHVSRAALSLPGLKAEVSRAI